jgi:hypothetical protein
MKKKWIVLFCLLSSSLCGEAVFIREASAPGWIEIAARVQGGQEDGRYLIYACPQKDNPTEAEILCYFADGFPIKMDGAYLVATLMPAQSYQVKSERCDLYLPFRMPELDSGDFRAVADDPYYESENIRSSPFDEDFFRNELLKKTVKLGLTRYYRFIEDDLSVKALAWLDGQGKPIVNEKGKVVRTADLSSEVSGLLVKAIRHGYGYGSPWKKAQFLWLPAKVRRFALLGKRYVQLYRPSEDRLQLRDEKPFYDPRLFSENPVFRVVEAEKKSLFRFPFTGGEVRFEDEIDRSLWRPLVSLESGREKVVVMKARKLNKLQEVFFSHETWELVSFAAFCCAILLFYLFQYLFVRGCEWKTIAWIITAGTSATGAGVFSLLWYRDFPLSLGVIILIDVVLLHFFALAALIYACLRKSGRAIFASSMVLFEIFLIWFILQIFRSGG